MRFGHCTIGTRLNIRLHTASSSFWLAQSRVVRTDRTTTIVFCCSLFFCMCDDQHRALHWRRRRRVRDYTRRAIRQPPAGYHYSHYAAMIISPYRTDGRRQRVSNSPFSDLFRFNCWIELTMKTMAALVSPRLHTSTRLITNHNNNSKENNRKNETPHFLCLQSIRSDPLFSSILYFNDGEEAAQFSTYKAAS